MHLGQSDLDPVAARRIAEALGRHDFHIGWSVSRADEIRAVDAMPPGTLDLLGIGQLLSHKPYSLRGVRPGVAQDLELRLEATSWDIAPGRRLVLAFQQGRIDLARADLVALNTLRQALPEMRSYLRAVVDEQRRRGIRLFAAWKEAEDGQSRG